MEGKYKLRNNLLVLLLVIIAVLLVILIYVLYENKSNKAELANLNNSSQGKISNQENVANTLNEKKQISLSDLEKTQINSKLADSHLFQLLISVKSNYDENTKSVVLSNGKFTDSQMAQFSFYYAMAKETNTFRNNSTYIDDKESISGYYEVDKNYIQSINKKIFDKEINLNNISDIVKNDNIILHSVTGLGIYYFKADKLYLNEKTQIYTLYVDSLNNNESNSDMSIASYSKSDVKDTYTLQYKIVNGEYMITSLTEEY